MVIDAHMHLWQIARGDYGWLTPDLPIHRDYTLADARRAARGVDGVILVQAAPTEAETRYLLDLAHRSDEFVRGVVGWVDLAAATAPAAIATLARDPLLRGLRPMLHDIDDPDWILRDAVAPGLAAMAGHGLTLDLLIRPVHLPRCIELAARHSGLQMVIDHCAKPDIVQDGFDPWAKALSTVAETTGIACKLSGLLTEATPGDGPAVLRRYMRHALAAFGPERLIWGSDWPVLTLASDYGTWRDAARSFIRDAAPEAEAAIFGDNANRIYGLAVMAGNLAQE